MDYKSLSFEELNDILPIYIKICRNVNGKNTYREYQRQIIGRSIRFHCSSNNHVAMFFGGLKTETLKDNLIKCYEWVFNINDSRNETIYIDYNGSGQYEISKVI